MFVLFIYNDIYGDHLVETKRFLCEERAIEYADSVVDKYARVEILQYDKDGNAEKIY